MSQGNAGPTVVECPAEVDGVDELKIVELEEAAVAAVSATEVEVGVEVAISIRSRDSSNRFSWKNNWIIPRKLPITESNSSLAAQQLRIRTSAAARIPLRIT